MGCRLHHVHPLGAPVGGWLEPTVLGMESTRLWAASVLWRSLLLYPLSKADLKGDVSVCCL